MEKRQLGKTDMHVSVLGFGGAEIGFEGAAEETVARLFERRPRRRPQRHRHGRMLQEQRGVIGGSRRIAAKTTIYSAMWTSRGDGQRGLVEGRAAAERRAKPEAAAHRPARPDATPQLFGSGAAQRRGGSRRWRKPSGAATRATSATAATARRPLRRGVRPVRHAANVRQASPTRRRSTSRLPMARQHDMGVIAKRPIANAVWHHSEKPTNAYHQPYWNVCENSTTTSRAAQRRGHRPAVHAERPGVDTAIVGTTKPGRWRENAAPLQAGPLPADEFERIRARWREVADASWVGQVEASFRQRPAARLGREPDDHRPTT